MRMADLGTLKKVEELMVKIARKIKGASAGMRGGFSGTISIKKDGFVSIGSKSTEIISIIGRQERTEKNLVNLKLLLSLKIKIFQNIIPYLVF